jgi:hypothetical protein
MSTRVEDAQIMQQQGAYCMVHSKLCTFTPCKDRYIMVYIHAISGCNQNPTTILVWIHNIIECRS